MIDDLKFCLEVVAAPTEKWPIAKQRVLSTKTLVQIAVLFVVVVTLLTALFRGPFSFFQFEFGVILRMAVTFGAAEFYLFLAPHFGGTTDRNSCQKLTVISMTPWVIGEAFLIIPYLGFLIYFIGACWAFCCEYIGLTEMTGVPAERKIVYFITSICCSIFLAIILSGVFAMLNWIF